MTRDDAVRLAEQIVGLVGLGDLSMALLTGSLARDIGDESSDVDIHLYGPDVDATSMPQAGFEPLGARHVFAVPTPTGWFTKLQIDGRYCDVEAVDVAVLDRAADTLAGAAAPPGWAVKLAAGLRDAVSVQGEEELEIWRQRLRYRDGQPRARWPPGRDGCSPRRRCTS